MCGTVLVRGNVHVRHSVSGWPPAVWSVLSRPAAIVGRSRRRSGGITSSQCNATSATNMQMYILCNNLGLLIYGLLFLSTMCRCGRIFGENLSTAGCTILCLVLLWCCNKSKCDILSTLILFFILLGPSERCKLLAN